MSLHSVSDPNDDLNNINSAQLKKNWKKRKSNVATNRSNQSHTFFFRIDDNDPELAYCKICELNFTGTSKKVYGYTRKGGNTTSMISHLQEVHSITRNNYTQYLNEYHKVNY